MRKLFKAMDGFMYMDMSDKAEAIFDSKIFELFAVWQRDDRVFKIPIMDRDDIQVARDYNKYLCIQVGPQCTCNVDKWADADKILHDGYIYVRYSDIKP